MSIAFPRARVAIRCCDGGIIGIKIECASVVMTVTDPIKLGLTLLTRQDHVWEQMRRPGTVLEALHQVGDAFHLTLG